MGDELYLRKADKDDLELLFTWANDSRVRQNAFHTDAITHEEHEKWFHKMMADPHRHQYILMNNEIAVGQVRLDCVDDKAEIDYSISPEYRGLGFGTVIINLLKQEVIESLPHIKRLLGKVKPENKASAACFNKCGFEDIYTCYEYKVLE